MRLSALKIIGMVFVILGLAWGQVDGDNIPTPTPIPVIVEHPEAPSADELLPIVEDLMKLDESCLLPCFWGFILGGNSIQETTDFVIDHFQQIPYISNADEREGFSDFPEPIRNIDFRETFLPLSEGQLHVIFGSIDDILVRIDINLFKSTNWLEENPFILSELLSIYGEPSQVYLRYSGAPVTGYVLAIVYEEQGFIVKYGFGNDVERLINERITDEGRVLICVEDPTYESIELILQVDGNPIPLIETLLPPVDDPSVFRPFWNIEDMTGLSIEEFTELFADNPQACIEMYSKAELRERGYE